VSLKEELIRRLEEEETRTVSNAFGGIQTQGSTKSYSVSNIRDWLTSAPLDTSQSLGSSLARLKSLVKTNSYKQIIGSLIRFSFLIELTNLKLGSTKMKTRWMPGRILMPQQGSFEPLQGTFKPGNDPRSSSSDVCCDVFETCMQIIADKIESEDNISTKLNLLSRNTSVPYEFVFDYKMPSENPIHTPQNINWILNQDIEWLIEARPIIWGTLSAQQKNKIQTKTYKTDRALTGKDKTNRAKRWETLFGDFQHATITQCWSVERKLLAELTGFDKFPERIKESLQKSGLMSSFNVSRCPVTLEHLDFEVLQNPAVHGRSDYQVGHLHPLKRGGYHEGANVCWKSNDGNRIQGDLTIEETIAPLDKITSRMDMLHSSHLETVESEIAKDS